MKNYVIIYEINNLINEQMLLGPKNINLKAIEEYYNCKISYRNSCFYGLDLDQEQINRIANILTFCEELLNSSIQIEYREFKYILNTYSENNDDLYELFTNKKVIITTPTSKQIKVRTINQIKYLESMKENDIVFGIGPAGTGKTYLAVAYAVYLLKNNHVKKIILVRPVVEAGEKLGYLPGDLKEKIDPYLIPLYDSLYEFLGKERVDALIEKGIIEVAPLAYMRGRTLENSVVILDEAQNTTTSQMKMFLTRLGFNSKMFITGDVTQIDLGYAKMSGLIEAENILKSIPGIEFMKFERSDVMRHPLVDKIIHRYEVSNND